MALPYKKSKGPCPVRKETTKEWTEIQRNKIQAEAAEVTNIEDLQAKVRTQVNCDSLYLPS